MISKTNFYALRYDIMFKFIFGYKENVHYTEWLLENLYHFPKGFLKGKLEVKNSLVLDKTSLEGHGLEADIVIERKDNGQIWNLEIYANGFDNEKQEKSYSYITTLFGTQLKIGEEYINNRRHEQINFIIDKNYPSGNFFMNSPEYNNLEFHKNGINIRVINIDRYKESGYNVNKEIKKLFKLMRANNKKEELEIVKGIEVLERMQKDMEEFRRDEWFKNHFSKATEWKRDINIKYKEGIEHGIEHEKLETAKKMLKNNIDVNMIKKCTGLSLQTIKSLVL